MSLPALVASTTMRLYQWSGTAATMQSVFLSSSRRRYSRVVGRLAPAISFARVCRPSYRSAAAAHVTGQRDRRAEQAIALHADADHPEAHGVTRRDAGARAVGLSGDRQTRGSSTDLQKLPAGPGGLLQGRLPPGKRGEPPIMASICRLSRLVQA